MAAAIISYAARENDIIISGAILVMTDMYLNDTTILITINQELTKRAIIADVLHHNFEFISEKAKQQICT